MLNADFNIVDSLKLITNNKNIKIIDTIIDKLSNGEIFNNIIINYTPDSFNRYFNSFIDFLSFNDSLKLSLDFVLTDLRTKKKLIKQIRYPLILLLITIISIILFYTIIFDQVIDFTLLFDFDLTTIYIIKNLVLSIVCILIFVLFISILIYFYIKYKNKITLVYIIMCQYFPIKIVKAFVSGQFIIFYNICYNVGLKSYDILNILKGLSSKPLVALLAFHIDDILLKGDSFYSAMSNIYIDDSLKRFIKIGSYSNDLDIILNQYLLLNQEKYNRFLYIIIKGIQVFSYSLIGIFIIMIYQILLMPLEIIGGL